MLGNRGQSDDITQNLFKLLCAILNLKPIQSATSLMDPKILGSYLDYIDLEK